MQLQVLKFNYLNKKTDLNFFSHVHLKSTALDYLQQSYFNVCCYILLTLAEPKYINTYNLIMVSKFAVK